MTDITKEVLARIEKALLESDDKFIVGIREDYGDQLNDIITGIKEEDGLETLANYVPGLEHVDLDCTAGDGSEAYFVVKDTATGQHLGIEGWYASYDGYTFDDLDFVPMEPFTIQHWRKA